MPLQPPVQHAHRYPLTTLLALCAAGASLLWWSGHDIGWMMPGARLADAPWRLVLCVLPHVNAVHLAFNLYWWWMLGTRVEGAWGSVRFGGVVLLLAATSSAAEYTLEGPGVGLSGVVYGLVGLLWFAQRADQRLSGAITRRTLDVFVAWFFLCIGATIVNVMRVGNVAHGTGALVGVVLGECVAMRGAARRAWWGVLAACAGLTAVCVAVAGARLPKPTTADTLSHQGYVALTRGQNDEAVSLLQRASKETPLRAEIWFNLGIAYERVHRIDEALRAFSRATELDATLKNDIRAKMSLLLEVKAHDLAEQGDNSGSANAAQAALQWDDGDPMAWRQLAAARVAQGDIAGGMKAYSQGKAASDNGTGHDAYTDSEFAAEMATAEMHARRYHDATTRLRTALTKDPESGRLLLLLGYSLEGEGSLFEALGAFGRAEKDPAQHEDAARKAFEIRSQMNK